MKTNVLLVALLLAGCSQGGQTPAGNASDTPASAVNSIAFFSARPPAVDLKDPDSWCNADWLEGVPVNVEADNHNRYYFNIGAGVYKATVRLGNTGSSWMLQRQNDGRVEVVTAENEPYCLSIKSNFALRENGFEYDNQRHQKYTVEMINEGQYSHIVLEVPVGKSYGLFVNRCADCR